MSWSLYKSLFPQQFSAIVDEVETRFGTYASFEGQTASQMASTLQGAGSSSGLSTAILNWITAQSSLLGSWDEFLGWFSEDTRFMALSVLDYYRDQQGLTEAQYVTELGNTTNFQDALFNSYGELFFKHFGDLLWTKVRSLDAWLTFRDEAFPSEQHALIDEWIPAISDYYHGRNYVLKPGDSTLSFGNISATFISEFAAWLYAKATSVATPSASDSWDQFISQFESFEEPLADILRDYHGTQNSQTVQDYIDTPQATREEWVDDTRGFYGSEATIAYQDAIQVRRENTVLWQYFKAMHSDADAATNTAFQTLADSLADPITSTSSALPTSSTDWDTVVGSLTNADAIITNLADWLVALQNKATNEFTSPTWADFLSLVHPHYLSAVEVIKTYHDDQTLTITDFLNTSATTLANEMDSRSGGAYNNGGYDFLAQLALGLSSFSADANKWQQISRNVTATRRGVVLFGESTGELNGEILESGVFELSKGFRTYDAFANASASMIGNDVIGTQIGDIHHALVSEFKLRALEADGVNTDNYDLTAIGGSLTDWELFELLNYHVWPIVKDVSDYHNSVLQQSSLDFALLSYEELATNLSSGLYGDFNTLIGQYFLIQHHTTAAFNDLENQFNSEGQVAVAGYRNDSQFHFPSFQLFFADYSNFPPGSFFFTDLASAARAQAAAYPNASGLLGDGGIAPEDTIIGKLADWLLTIANAQADWAAFETAVGADDWTYVGVLKTYYDDQSTTYSQFAAKSIADVVTDLVAADAANDFFGPYAEAILNKVAEVLLPGRGELIRQVPFQDIGGLGAVLAASGVQHGTMNPDGTADLEAVLEIPDAQLSYDQLKYMSMSGSYTFVNFILPVLMGGYAKEAYDQRIRGTAIFDFVANQFLPEQRGSIRSILEEIADTNALSPESLVQVATLFSGGDQGEGPGSLWFNAIGFKLALISSENDLVLARTQSYRELVRDQEDTTLPAPTLPAPDLSETFIVTGQLYKSGVTPQEVAPASYDILVEREDADNPGSYITLLETRTNERGGFSFAFSATPAQDGTFAQENFRITATDDNAVATQSTYTITPPEVPFFSMEVPYTAPEVPTTPIADLPNYGSYHSEITNYLSTNGLASLSDVRLHGGLAGKAANETGIANNIAQAREIDAHAEYEMFHSDLVYNQAVIDAGYTSVQGVAAKRRKAFVTELEAVAGAGETEALAFHQASTMLTDYVKNRTAQISADLATGTYKTFGVNDPESPGGGGGGSEEPAIPYSALLDIYAKDCACDNCETSVSPLAYLSSLLEYTLEYVDKYVDNEGVNVTITDLVTDFEQDFSRLTTICSEMSKEVCQLRLAVELLWRIVTNPSDQTLLDKLYENYTLPVYQYLLSEAGASFSELRLLMNNTASSAEERKARLANRMQIAVDEVDTFWVEQRFELTEDKLYELFGLQPTAGDPYSNARKLGDLSSPVVLRHTFTDVKWNVNTDEEGFVYMVIPQHNFDFDAYDNDSPEYVSFYRNSTAGAAFEVARGAILKDVDNDRYVAKIYTIKDSGLSGEIEFYKTELDGLPTATFDAVSFQLVPRLLAKRYQHQLQRWREQDKLDRSAFEDRPIIDPDLIGPDDFRVLETSAGNVSMFETLWLERYSQLYSSNAFSGNSKGLVVELNTTSSSSENKQRLQIWIWNVLEQPSSYGNLNTGQYVIFDYSGIQSLTPPVSSFATPSDDYLSRLLVELDAGSQAAITDIRDALNLTISAFRRLTAIWQQPVISDEDLEQAKHILVSAGKRAFSKGTGGWIDVENTSPDFKPEEFWPSITAPRQGTWDLSTRNAFVNDLHFATPVNLPMIDPDFIAIDELPDPPLRDTGNPDTLVELYNSRRAEIDGILSSLQSTLDAELAIDPSVFTILDTLANEVYGSPPPSFVTGNTFTEDLLAVNQQLNQGTATPSDPAVYVQQDLKMTLEEFEVIADIAELLNNEATVPAALWEQALVTFTKSKKYIDFYENNTWSITENTSEIWRLYKHSLPSNWRASQADRSAFERYVEQLYEAPIIEPDILGPGDFYNPETGTTTVAPNPLYVEFKARKTAVQDTFYPDPLVPVGNVVDLDAFMTGAVSDLTLVQVTELEEAYNAGLPEFSARLSQLTLSSAEYVYLLKLNNKLVGGTPLTVGEVESLADLLTNVRKKREYPKWNYAEAEENYFVNPLHFVPLNLKREKLSAYYNAIFSDWRSDRGVRRRYERLLRTRVDSLQGQADALMRTLQEADSNYLQGARDALVPFYEGGGSTPQEKATDIGKRYLIDMGYECCSNTTRLAQAITTVQTFLLQLRLNQAHPELQPKDPEADPNYTIEIENFDDDWNWLSSYERWRSLMFVYLYPENLLNPEFHPRRTHVFQDIINEVHNDRHFGPTDACKQLEKYEDYINDIRHLRLGDAAIAYLPARDTACTESRPDGEPDPNAPLNYYTYLVGAHSTVSKKGYLLISQHLTAQDANDPKKENRSPFQPKSWEYIPGFDNVREILAAEILRTEAGRFLYVFAEANDELTGEILLIGNRLSLETWQWEDKQVVDVPEDKDVLKQEPVNPVVTQRWVFAERSTDTSQIVFGRTWQIPFKNESWVFLWQLKNDVKNLLSLISKFEANVKQKVYRWDEVEYDYVTDERKHEVDGAGITATSEFLYTELEHLRSVQSSIATNPSVPQSEVDTPVGNMDFHGTRLYGVLEKARPWVLGDVSPVTFGRPNEPNFQSAKKLFKNFTTNQIINLLKYAEFYPASYQTFNHDDVFNQDGQFYYQCSFFSVDDSFSVRHINVNYFFSMLRKVNLVHTRNNSGCSVFEPHFTYEIGNEIGADYPLSLPDGKYSFYAVNAYNFRVDGDPSGTSFVYSAHDALSEIPTTTRELYALDDFYYDHLLYRELEVWQGYQFYSYYLTIQNKYRWSEALKHHLFDTRSWLVNDQGVQSRKAVENYLFEGKGKTYRFAGAELLSHDAAPSFPDESSTFDYRVYFNEVSGATLTGLITLPVSHKAEGWDKETTFGTEDHYPFVSANPTEVKIAPTYVSNAPKNPKVVVYGNYLSALFPDKHDPDNPFMWSSLTGVLDPDLLDYNISLNMTKSVQDTLGWHSYLLLIKEGITDPYYKHLIYEAYYFMPLFIAQQLEKNGYYIEALELMRGIYDYTKPIEKRKIFWGLVAEESIQTAPGGWFANSLEEWLDDPTNPHTVAATRPNSYTKYTIFTIVRMLLGYADQEYTRDTAESVPRAVQLYETALSLLEDTLLAGKPKTCEELVDACSQDIPAEWWPEWLRLRAMLLSIDNKKFLEQTMQGVGGICDILNDETKTWEERIFTAEGEIEEALGGVQQQELLLTAVGGVTGTVVSISSASSPIYGVVQNNSVEAQAMQSVGQYTYGYVLQMSQQVKDGIETLAEESVDLYGDNPNHDTEITFQQLRQNGDDAAIIAPMLGFDSLISLVPGQTVTIGAFIERLRMWDRVTLPPRYIPNVFDRFCTVPNPLASLFLARAKANLFKIRNCMNISGLRRQNAPYAAPTDAFSGAPGFGGQGFLTTASALQIAPTPYRYQILIQRAKELVNYAMQLENSLLSALEKLDAAMYSELQARQDLELSRQSVRLQNLRVKEAETGVDLAETQLEKAEFSVEQYDELANNPFAVIEQELITLYEQLAGFQRQEAGFRYGVELANTGLQALNIAAITSDTTDTFSVAAKLYKGLAFTALGTAATLGGFALNSQIKAINRQKDISLANIRLSREIRNRQYALQRDLAQFDVRLGNLQVRQAEQRVDIVEQEKAIAELRVDQAQDTLNFLQTKFTNAEFYDWMSRELENIYSYFLQQATSMAKLAEQQLAFERQEPLAGMIQPDYWVSVQDNFAYDFSDNGNNTGVDRKGITGSARLLQDMTKLDLYGFETRRRKQQVTKTISLAALFPGDFAQFQRTGRLNFYTPMELFKRDFPSHYLRIIRQVRISVIALVPPNEGIKAQMTNLGNSYTTTYENNIERRVQVSRDPEVISLSSPINSNGLFELQTDNDLLLPFEGLGVETSWEFVMNKASNPVDFNTIADVLITIDYTAMNNGLLGQEVAQTLNDDDYQAERVFSLKNQFADAWFDLHNPDQVAYENRWKAKIRIDRSDFPTNLSDISVLEATIFVITTDDENGDSSADNGAAFKSKALGRVMRVGLSTDDASGAIPLNEISFNKFGVATTRSNSVNDSSAYNLYNMESAGLESLIGAMATADLPLEVIIDIPIDTAESNESISSTPLRQLIQNDEVDDILLILTYGGNTPSYSNDL